MWLPLSLTLCLSVCRALSPLTLSLQAPSAACLSWSQIKVHCQDVCVCVCIFIHKRCCKLSFGRMLFMSANSVNLSVFPHNRFSISEVKRPACLQYKWQDCVLPHKGDYLFEMNSAAKLWLCVHECMFPLKTLQMSTMSAVSFGNNNVNILENIGQFFLKNGNKITSPLISGATGRPCWSR